MVRTSVAQPSKMSILLIFFIVPLQVEGISLAQINYSSDEFQDGGKQEGLSMHQALPESLEQQEDARPFGENTKSQDIDYSKDQPASLFPSGDLNQNNDQLERGKRSPVFKQLPTGELCLLGAYTGQNYYDHTDPVTGHQCQCELCSQGRIVAEDCECDSSLKTQCVLVDRGRQYMPAKNKCKTGIDCGTCAYPSIQKAACTATSNTTCTCGNEGYGENCALKPRCDKDHEPMLGDGSHHDVMICRPCEKGYHQPNNNSTDRCRKIPDPSEPETPNPSGPVPQRTSPKMVTDRTYGTVMSPTSTPAGNSTPGVNCEHQTAGTPTTEEPKMGRSTNCMTWEFSIIAVVILVVGMLLGGGAMYWYLTSKHDLVPKKAAPISKEGEPGFELDEVTTGTEGNTNESTETSALKESSENNKRGRGRGRGKQSSKGTARKRGGISAACQVN